MKKQPFAATRPVPLALALALAFASALALAAPASAQTAARYDHSNRSGRQLLLRTAAIDVVAARYGLLVLDRSGAADDALYLVEGPTERSAAAMVKALAADAQVSLVEPVALASLPAVAGANLLEDASADLQRTGTYATRCQSNFLSGSELWAGYSDQRAARAIKLATAHQASWSCGAGVRIAVIDTGVDETHPLLQGAVLPGYDLLDPEGTGSEWSLLDHSVRAIVEHSVRAIVEESAPAVMAGDGQAVAAGGAMAPVLGENAILAFEETGLPPYFGHGTMVAGLIRLVAPGAQIVPVRAFDGSGTANVYDLVRAIRWAADQGVQVINMSFSMEASPSELRSAIRYAESRGVLMVAAAGNQGDRLKIYPAAYAEVLGAAAQSTAASGALATFSNWGTAVADLAAPGSAVVTTFPGGLYAAGWGTSFSSPLVAGTAALLIERPYCGLQNRELRGDLLNSTVARPALYGKVLSGQLDVYRAWVYAGN